MDSIEDHVITAQVNVEEGTSLLAQVCVIGNQSTDLTAGWVFVY